jgi:hypothetical protein
MRYFPFFATASVFAVLRLALSVSSLRFRLRRISFCLSRMGWFSFPKSVS